MQKNRSLQKAAATYRTNDGWWSRGYLPHFHAADKVQFITLRLADSLPRSVTKAIWNELLVSEATSAVSVERMIAHRKRVEQLLDAGYGACWLERREVASIVIASIGYLVNQGHHIPRWVLMPNHLHMLIAIAPHATLSSVLRSFKVYTARKANEALGRSGAFWFPEFFDRYIRNSDHFNAVVQYIDNNPVRAGLVQTASQWEFSSAGWPASHDR